MSDKLTEIPCAQWSELRDMYLCDWPTNMMGYYTIDNFIRWTEKKPDIDHLHVYSLNNDWSDGTFLVVDRYQLFVNTLNKSLDRLTQAISLLDWTHGFKVSSFLERHRPAVINVIDSKNLKREYDSKTLLYFMPRNEASQLETELPKGITLKPLTQEHAEMVNELWPNRHHGSLFFIKRLIDWNPNVGAYTEDGQLIAWCLRLQAGPLGALQTDNAFKNRGIGSLVVKDITKQLANMNMDTCAFVNTTNEASVKLFEKVGFKVVDNGYWLRTYPVVPFEWED